MEVVGAMLVEAEVDADVDVDVEVEVVEDDVESDVVPKGVELEGDSISAIGACRMKGNMPPE